MLSVIDAQDRHLAAPNLDLDFATRIPGDPLFRFAKTEELRQPKPDVQACASRDWKRIQKSCRGFHVKVGNAQIAYSRHNVSGEVPGLNECAPRQLTALHVSFT